MNASASDCVSLFDWKDASEILNCSSFLLEDDIPDIDKCLNDGHFASSKGIKATDACCECYNGYDGVTHGGYNGTLIGVLLRIGYMNYTDSFAHNVTESGQLSGPIFDFIEKVSTSSGFGMIQKDDYPDDDCVEGNKILCKSFYEWLSILILFLQIVPNF